MASREKVKGNTMVLPNIPKMTDDKNKLKYMTDYEKYEAELLKHHLGHPESTITMGLKNLPVNFDRKVPSLDEPTAVEVEYEKYLAALNARKKKKRFGKPRTTYAGDHLGTPSSPLNRIEPQKLLASGQPYSSAESSTLPLPMLFSPNIGGSSLHSATRASVAATGMSSSRFSMTSKYGSKADPSFAGDISGTDSGIAEPGTLVSAIQAGGAPLFSSSGILLGDAGGKAGSMDASGGQRSSTKVIVHSSPFPRRSLSKQTAYDGIENKNLPSVTFPVAPPSILSAPGAVSSPTGVPAAVVVGPSSAVIAAKTGGGAAATRSSSAPRPSSSVGGGDGTQRSSVVSPPVPRKRVDGSRSASLQRASGGTSAGSISFTAVTGKASKEEGATETASGTGGRLIPASRVNTRPTIRGATAGLAESKDRLKHTTSKSDPSSSAFPTSSVRSFSSGRRNSPEKKTTVEHIASRLGTEKAPAAQASGSNLALQQDKKNMDPEEVQRFLLLHSPPFGRTPSPPGVNPVSVGDDLAECADLLRVLVDPPKEYAASVKLDLNWLDIDWIVHKRARPPQLTTLQNWKSVHHSDYVAPRLTSPRSALVLLRNGVSMQDLMVEQTKDEDLHLPQDPALRTAVQTFRQERGKARRDELLEFLLNDYHTICSQYSQQDLITAVNTPVNLSERHDVRSCTSLSERQEKQRKQFEINKLRMARVNDLAESLHAKRKAAEERRLRAEEEQREALEAKLRSEAEARKVQQQRLMKQRQKLEEMEEAYLENLKQRQELAQRRNEERLQAQARQFELRQKIRREKEEQRKKRFAHSAALQEMQSEEVQLKRKQAEEKMTAMEEMRRAKVLEEKQLLKEKQARVQESRKEAARRAAEKEESFREVAVQRQREVEERLSRFIEMRNEQAVTRAKAEELKKEKRMDALQSSKRAEEEFKMKTEEKQLKHMEVYNEISKVKLLNLTLVREREREEAKAKAFAIKKLQRMEEFKKIRTISKLILKRRIAEHLEEQRAKLLQASLAERDKLFLEKQDLRERLAAEKV